MFNSLEDILLTGQKKYKLSHTLPYSLTRCNFLWFFCIVELRYTLRPDLERNLLFYDIFHSDSVNCSNLVPTN